MYSCIGSIYIKSTDIIQIGDPAACEFIDKFVSFSPGSKKKLELNAFLDGNYYAYHKCRENAFAFVDELIMVHESIQAETTPVLSKRNMGTVSVQISGTVFLCKKELAFNPKYSYFALEQDALYDVNQIIRYLKENTLQKSINKTLLNLCENHITEGYVAGEDIQNLLQSVTEIPSFLREIDSSHWSASVARILSDVPATQITGGFVSNCAYKEMQVSTLYDDESLVGIQMHLY